MTTVVDAATDDMSVRRASSIYGNSTDLKRLGLTTEIRGVTFDVDSLTPTELRLLVARIVHTHPAVVARASSHVLRILRNDGVRRRDGGDNRCVVCGSERRGGGGVSGDHGEDDGGGGSSPPPSTSSPPLPDPLDPAEADDPETLEMAADGLTGADDDGGTGVDDDGGEDRHHGDLDPDREKAADDDVNVGDGTKKSIPFPNFESKRGGAPPRAKGVAGKQKSPPKKKERKRDRPKSFRPSWENRFEQLKLLKATVGHTKPTRDWVDRHPEWKAVFHWSNNQRRYRNKIVAGEKPNRDTLTVERLAKLNSIGFQWSNPQKNPHKTMTWEERFEELLKLKAMLGHTNPSEEWLRDNPDWNSWNVWARRQRTNEKAGREEGAKKRRRRGCNALTEERIRKLNAVGFEWWD